MTDDSAAERNALQTVWPLSNRLLCHFHVAQAEWRWISSNINLKDRKKLMSKFRKVRNILDFVSCVVYVYTLSFAY